MGHTHPLHLCGLVEEWLECCLAEEDLGVLVVSQVNISHQCAQVSKKDKGILACTRNSVASWTKEVIASFYVALIRPNLDYLFSFGHHTT